LIFSTYGPFEQRVGMSGLLYVQTKFPTGALKAISITNPAWVCA
jgi:hypothetical protein